MMRRTYMRQASEMRLRSTALSIGNGWSNSSSALFLEGERWTCRWLSAQGSEWRWRYDVLQEGRVGRAPLRNGPQASFMEKSDDDVNGYVWGSFAVGVPERPTAS